MAHGRATSSDLSEIFVGDVRKLPISYHVYALDGGYLLKKNWLDMPLDAYLKTGLAYYNQPDYYDYGNLDDVVEATIYIKVYWNIDLFGNRARIALGEGLSYTFGYLEPEYDEAVMDEDNHSRYLNYLDFSIDLDFGKLIGVKSLYNTYIGWAVKHRSGIFGLVNNVKEGGANYNVAYIEKNF